MISRVVLFWLLGAQVVLGNLAIANPADSVSTVDSTYDPQVEFLEIAVNVNGTNTSKVYGPDASGTFGGMQGVGGLETLYISGHTNAYRQVQDYFGNVIGTITNNGVVVSWNAARFSSYGPVPGYQPALLSPDTTLAQCLDWRGKRIDPSGNYYFGARSEYDPVAGRFSSADSMGHGACKDLCSFCDGDPVNKWDPDGRFGKQIANDYQNIVDNLTEAKDIADSQITYADSDFHYADEDQEVAGKWSELVDMVPGVGGIKQWIELDTGKDMFTGEWIQGNQYLQAVGIVANFLPATFGPASLLEGGGEAAFFGAGERGLIEAGEIGIVEGADDIISVDFTEGQKVAAEATFAPGEVMPNGQVAGVGPGAMYSGESPEVPGETPLYPGRAGSFEDLDSLSRIGDGLTPHHMPQAALDFTSREEGGAIVLPQSLHVETRTYGFKGVQTAQADAGVPFRQVLAQDILDLRKLGGSQYNQGIQDLLQYYRDNFPELIAKPPKIQ